MGLAENKKLVHAFYEAGNRGDVEAAMETLADDIQWTNIGSTKYSGSFAGKGELVERLIGPLFGQLKAGIASSIRNVVAEGDFVVVQASGAAQTKDGRPYNNTYCHVFRIRGNKIVEVAEYMDTELVTAVFGR